MGYRRFQSTNHDRHYREWSSQHRVFHQVLPPSPRKHSFLVGNPVFTSGKFLIYMTSVDAILQDYQDNVIGRMPLPFLFNISGKGKPSNKPTKALRRAVRGVSAQQHSNYLSSHLNNLLKPDIHTDSVAPGIFPVVPNPSARGPQHIDNGTVQELMNPHVEVPVGDNRQTSKSVLFLFCSLSLTSFYLGNSNQQPSWVDTMAGVPPATDPFYGYAAFALINAFPLMPSTTQQSSELGFDPRNMGMAFL